MIKDIQERSFYFLNYYLISIRIIDNYKIYFKYSLCLKPHPNLYT